MAIEEVRLKDTQYFCSECQLIHTYSGGELFEIHTDLRVGNREWLYERIEND